MNTDLTSLLVGIVAVLAFFGNVLITIVGLKLPTHPKNLTQVFLISLAMADLLLSVQVPFYIMGLQNIIIDTKMLSEFCNISSFLLWTAIKANIFMIMVMGVDRMVATCFAGTYLSRVKRQYAVGTCIVVWAVSLVLAAIPGVISQATQTSNPYHYDARFQTCTVLPDFCHDKEKNAVFLVYFLIELAVTFGIPLISIVVCYVMICSRIFSLKKIKTIGRTFSKRRKIISAKLGVSERKDRDTEAKEAALGKSAAVAERQGKPSSEGNYGVNDHNNKEYFVRDCSDSSFVRCSMSDKGYETQISDCTQDGSTDQKQGKVKIGDPRSISSSGFRLTIPEAPGFKLKTSPTPSEAPILLTVDQIEECSRMEECGSMAMCSDRGECQDISPNPAGENPPTLSSGPKDPPAFSIDPTMQRRRFNFFTTDDDKFGVCPEPGTKPSIIANSIQVIEKHYCAIESARDELAKKMRIYQYQIRVARTAVVVCTFFVVCYLAYEIGILYVLWGVHCDDRHSGISTYIGRCHFFLFINSALNVLIYGMMHRTVRADIMKIIKFFSCTRKKASERKPI